MPRCGAPKRLPLKPIGLRCGGAWRVFIRRLRPKCITRVECLPAAPSRCPGGVPYAVAKGRLTSLRALGSTNSRLEGGAELVKVVKGGKLVEPSGIEPLTSCIQRELAFRCQHQLQRRRSLQAS